MNLVLRQRRKQFVIPTFVLILDDSLHRCADGSQLLFGGAAIGADGLRTVLNLLQETGNTDLHELVQIIGGDCQKAHALEQGIGSVARLFQHKLIKGQPLQVAVQTQLRIFQILAFHRPVRKGNSSIAWVLRPDERLELGYAASGWWAIMRMIVALLLLVLSILATAVTFASGPNGADQRRQQIEELFSGIVKPDAPGLAVLVKFKGETLLETGYGVRELRTRDANSPDTDFRLASFTKQFTAMAIMLLVHDGRLHYDDHLTDIFPEFPAYGKSITIRNLLNHTSGLPDYEDLMEREEKERGATIWSPEKQIQDDEVLRLLEKATAPKFAPGTSWAYSNSGYVVLGLIVAKVSGMPYRDFLQKRIFAPADMRQSVVYQKGINEIPNRSLGHSLENGKWVQTDQSSTSATLGDGGVYSNLEDLAKWDEALQKHTLLSAAEMAPALTPVKLNDGSQPHWPMEPDGDNLAPGKPVSYGFGWFLDSYQGQARMWHTGSTMGFRTVIQRFTSDDLTIVILANRADIDTKAVSDRVAELLLNSAN